MKEMTGSPGNKVLIAVDLSENSLKAVDYVGGMLRCHELAEITLLTVIKEPSADIVPEEAERARMVDEARSETLALMEQAGSRLTALGIAEKHIRIKIQVCRKPMSISDLILHEQQEGGYGTLVVGRRGVSKKEEFLFGSVSSRVVRDAKHCAVWVIE
ncbi:MAG: universal stress protein [Syntrophobacteraceae bacterium]|jgi:nucleotide-binding universal stress UspA family protein|nr:universal stress protein [Syntrophobacteraceae bacterium]